MLTFIQDVTCSKFNTATFPHKLSRTESSAYSDTADTEAIAPYLPILCKYRYSDMAYARAIPVKPYKYF